MNANRIRLEIKRLQNEVEVIGTSSDGKKDYNGITQLRDEIIQLKQDINQVSNELSRYDLERYSEQIKSLLIIVQKRILSYNDPSNSGNRKNMHLKRKPGFSNVINNRKSLSMTILNSITAKTVNKKIVLSDNVSILQNLENCQICSSSQKCNVSKHISGSITMSQVNESHIILLNLPFTKGNIFITDCINSIIIIQVPSKGKVQLRLHNLLDCKIKISLKEPITSEIDKQTVVIENIKNCLFDLASKSILTIENFSNINQINEKPKDYFFAEFRCSSTGPNS